jgi:hypothetical protein
LGIYLDLVLVLTNSNRNSNRHFTVGVRNIFRFCFGWNEFEWTLYGGISEQSLFEFKFDFRRALCRIFKVWPGKCGFS